MRQDEHATAPTLLLRNVTVIDGVTESPAPGQDVLVEGDRIRAVAPTGTLHLPTTASPRGYGSWKPADTPSCPASSTVTCM